MSDYIFDITVEMFDGTSKKFENAKLLGITGKEALKFEDENGFTHSFLGVPFGLQPKGNTAKKWLESRRIIDETS